MEKWDRYPQIVQLIQEAVAKERHECARLLEERAAVYNATQGSVLREEAGRIRNRPQGEPMTGWEKAYRESQGVVSASLPAGVGDPQLRHLDEENRYLRRQLADARANQNIREAIEQAVATERQACVDLARQLARDCHHRAESIADGQERRDLIAYSLAAADVADVILAHSVPKD